MTESVTDMASAGHASSQENCSFAKAWYAIYTIVRHEKAVNSVLNQRNLETFLPLREKTRQWKDRQKTIQFPLFPGYLFVNMSLPERWNVLDIRGVVRILSKNGFPCSVPIHQIDAIKTLLKSNLVYNQSPYLTEGAEVSVINGPLRGVKGKISAIKNQLKLILSIDFIQQGVVVSIDEKDIELV